ncbi:hypothetical protein [Pantoea sp. At-9b]|jgi:hypothetical protein|uniref:hypothetical protein n=1 Tax=Pantoea sp. (strain At-9b) TaxID=592316 RepID=UPI0001B3DEEF|nr:hypothetical protein [Pantoea sp. At-9b]ADU70564.1 hypothetical protein Pat9b_3268 [Pantoea sp. At-9b]
MMRLIPLFLVTALTAFSAIAGAQLSEPFSPPAGLHPHQTCQQHEISGDNPLPQNNGGMLECGHNDALQN